MQTLIQDKFTENFKAMWEEGSKPQTLWKIIEDSYQILLGECSKLDRKQALARSDDEVYEDMQKGIISMELLGPECIAGLWDRIVLRTHLKVRDAMQMLFYSANTANAYGCALSVRSIMEHVALLQYFVDQVPWRHSRAIPTKDAIKFLKKLFILAKGSKVDWDKLISGGIRNMVLSGEWKRKTEPGLPPISELLQALDAALMKRGRLHARGEVKFLYGVLCDVVHPNWGGDFIYAPRMHRTLECTRLMDEQFKLCAILFCPCTVELISHLFITAGEIEGDKVLVMWPGNAHKRAH